jgi:co-chaperonin GroES (HSP10)
MESSAPRIVLPNSGIAKPVHVREDIDTAGPKETVAKQLPKPTGYKLLIMLPESTEKTEGGIIRPEETRHREEVGSICGFVLDMGPDAYVDKQKFPNGAYCKKGDWIMFRSYSGTRFLVHGQELRLLNDDCCEAVVENPYGIVKI